MDTQNINPGANKDCNDLDTTDEARRDNISKTGIDKWNDRLDNNLEPESSGDENADENAKDYSEEKGSGNQSDRKED